jgi:hypothetical protein
VLLSHDLPAICDGPGCVRGLSTRIRRLKARVAGHQHAYTQTKDCRSEDRRKDGSGTIEDEESHQGSDDGTGDRPHESTQRQSEAQPLVHPALGRGLGSDPTPAPRFG